MHFRSLLTSLQQYGSPKKYIPYQETNDSFLLEGGYHLHLVE